jgi:LysR family hydrogen peroxide-inducible transcriptional activator
MAPSGSEAVSEIRAGVGDLRAFVTVARLGAVARAAEALGRTQPSVSARLAALEAAWNTRLFRRVARGMVLTPEGTRLLPFAETILRDLEKLENEAGLPSGSSAELRLGAGDALGRRLLPRALARLLEKMPGIDVRLREGTGTTLLDALRDGDIDLALIVAKPDEPAPPGISVEPLFDSPVQLMAPPGLLDDAASSVDLAELADQPIVTLQPGSSFRAHLETAFARNGLRLRPAVEVGNLSLVRRFVITGLGVAPVPAVAFSPRPRPARYALLEMSEVPEVCYAYAVRSGAPLPVSAQRLLEQIAGKRA